MFLLYAKKALFYVLVLIAPFLIIYFVYFYGYTVPVGDEWGYAPFIKKMFNRELTFSDFWVQCNEHRPIFPTLIILILALVTKWDIMYELYTNVVIAGLTLMFLYSLIRQTVSNHIPSWLMIALSFTVFSLVQWENWLWGFTIQIFLSTLATVVAVWSVYKWPGQMKGILIAMGAAVIASYSFNNGLLTWIVIIMLLMQRERKWKHILLWITAFAATTICYYYGYTKPSHHPSLLYSMSHLYDYTRYILTYLGSPLSFGIHTLEEKYVSTVIGLLLVIIICILTIRIKRSSKEYYIRLLPWQALGAYVILSAAATGIGRLGFGINQALESRYTTISILFIISTIIIAIIWIKQYIRINGHLPRKLVIAISCISTLFICSYILNFLESKKQMIIIGEKIKKTALCLEYIDTAPDKSLKIFCPDVNTVRSNTKILLDLGLTFKTIQWDKLQKSKGGLYSVDGINGLNIHMQVQPILIDISKNSILTLNGWAVDEKAGDIADSVYITLDDKPIAHAYYGVKRSDIARYFKIDRYKFSGWEASININGIDQGEHKISLRIVSKDKKNYFEPKNEIMIRVHK